MKAFKFAAVLTIILCTASLTFSQTQPNIENGFKSFGSYQGGDIDTVNLMNGNLMIHIPLLSYSQRGGKFNEGYFFTANSKNWQVGEYFDHSNVSHQKWVLQELTGVDFAVLLGISIHRNRYITTDLTGNQTVTESGYAITTPDGSYHWLSSSLANGNGDAGWHGDAAYAHPWNSHGP